MRDLARIRSVTFNHDRVIPILIPHGRLLTLVDPRKQPYDTAWLWFQPILEDMFDEGMCFYEAYITNFALPRFTETLGRFVSDHPALTLTDSVWQNDTPESMMAANHSVADYANYFLHGELSLLNCDYKTRVQTFDFNVRLIFEPPANLEIIMRRENLLPRDQTEDRFVASCAHFSRLRDIFGGTALFLGPDTLDYPESANVAPDVWLKLE